MVSRSSICSITKPSVFFEKLLAQCNERQQMAEVECGMVMEAMNRTGSIATGEVDKDSCPVVPGSR